MNGEFLQAIEQIAREKGIKQEILFEAIDAAYSHLYVLGCPVVFLICSY